jgi:7,8-dihydroneopterin aldolase/epimerase/oxygenase
MPSRSRLLRCAAMAPDRDDDLDDLEDPYDDDEGDAAPQTEVTIEITGLSLYTHH